VIDSDVPWIPRDSNPTKGAKIFHIDVDPLKEQMPLFYISAQKRYKADAETALTQILEALEGKKLDSRGIKNRLQRLSERHQKRIEKLDKLEIVGSNSVLTTSILMGYFRKIVPKQSTIMIEVAHENLTLLIQGITQYGPVFDHYRSEVPGKVFASGAGSLGWGLGASIGARQALNDTAPKSDAIVATV